VRVFFLNQCAIFIFKRWLFLLVVLQHSVGNALGKAVNSAAPQPQLPPVDPAFSSPANIQLGDKFAKDITDALGGSFFFVSAEAGGRTPGEVSFEWDLDEDQPPRGAKNTHIQEILETLKTIPNALRMPKLIDGETLEEIKEPFTLTLCHSPVVKLSLPD
jgi:hypothetical protein